MKPIKFDLPFNGTKLCRLDDLKNNLTAELLEPFRTGKLARWLRVRKLEELADNVEALLAAEIVANNQREVQSLKGLMELFDGETDENLLRAAIAERKQALPSVQKSNDEEIEQLKTAFEKEIETLKTEIEQLRNPPKPKITETQTGQFIARDDGTALDTKTGLTWCRFSMGQRWENGTVSGDATEMNWDDAMKVGDSFKCGGFTDWRLPTRDELKSIVKSGASNPSIDTTVFPATPSVWFWSASVNAVSPNGAWIVDFDYGSDSYVDKGYYAVRLVRGGQSF